MWVAGGFKLAKSFGSLPAGKACDKISGGTAKGSLIDLAQKPRNCLVNLSGMREHSLQNITDTYLH